MNIDSAKAKEIASRFLEQYHSVITTSAEQEGDKWIVTAKVGFLPRQIKVVQINAQTGKIIGYE